MKKVCLIATLLLLLSGCGSQDAFETVADVQAAPVSAPVQQILLQLPQDAAMQTMQSSDGAKLYLCDGYTVTVQTMASGDLEKTLRTATGYEKDDLALMETVDTAGKRYECVFPTAGEGHTQMGRVCIVDDGSYHYVLTVMVPEDAAGSLQQQIQGIMDSFQVVDQEFPLNTGS